MNVYYEREATGATFFTKSSPLLNHYFYRHAESLFLPYIARPAHYIAGKGLEKPANLPERACDFCLCGLGGKVVGEGRGRRWRGRSNISSLCCLFQPCLDT